MRRTTAIQHEITKHRQGVQYLKIVKHSSGHKLRIKIYSDSYKFQCTALVEVFNPQNLAWNEVARIPHAAMDTPDKLVYNPYINQYGMMFLDTYFRKDADKLIKMALAVLV